MNHMDRRAYGGPYRDQHLATLAALKRAQRWLIAAAALLTLSCALHLIEILTR